MKVEHIITLSDQVRKDNINSTGHLFIESALNNITTSDKETMRIEIDFAQYKFEQLTHRLCQNHYRNH